MPLFISNCSSASLRPSVRPFIGRAAWLLLALSITGCGSEFNLFSSGRHPDAQLEAPPVINAHAGNFVDGGSATLQGAASLEIKQVRITGNATALSSQSPSFRVSGGIHVVR